MSVRSRYQRRMGLIVEVVKASHNCLRIENVTSCKRVKLNDEDVLRLMLKSVRRSMIGRLKEPIAIEI